MRKPPRVLAIASGGGHWVQLLRLTPAWDGCSVSYATTTPDFHGVIAAHSETRGQARPKYFAFTEANRWQKLRLLRQFFEVARIILLTRPDVVVSTGAAPGYLAIRLARLLGARTAWIDSIANAEELSLSGQKVGAYADLWLTQWPELEAPNGPIYRGSVL